MVGLAASRLTEEFYRPAVVVEQGEAESRGSCRSIPEFNITRALDECAELLVRHGGHAAAAGFTVPTDKLDELARRLLAIAQAQLGGRDLSPALHVDAEIHARRIELRNLPAAQAAGAVRLCQSRAGAAHRNMLVRDARTVGADGAHLKLALMDEKRVVWDAIAFRQSHHSAWLRRDMRIAVAFHLEMNEWNGDKRLQFNVLDLKPAD